MAPTKTQIIFYVPNLIGFVRIALLVAAFGLYFDAEPVLFVVCYAIQAILDGIDGVAARKLSQTSGFGAWFDVVIDNVGRSLLWTWMGSRVGSLLICVEWLVFCCTHTWGAHWKSSFSAAPGWAKAVMAHGFKTPVGVLAIAGLHVLPIWLYVRQQRSSLAVWGPLQPLVDSPAMLGVFLLGRAVCLTVELWVLFKHCDNLLVDDVAEKRKE